MADAEIIDDLLDQWESADPKPSTESLCADHAHLQQVVRDRIRLLVAVNGFVGGSPETCQPPDAVAAPTSIGPYRILEKLGEGGMGDVYKAEQRHPIQRIVAVKVIKLGLATQQVIARFDTERQALARMDNAHVAKVLDAGADLEGRPYFVMEYVPGVAITQYADDNRLSIRERLELFLQVCDGIAHAHTKALIHRDIKASNVLAYTSDGARKVKIIDFGIVKALTGDRLSEQTFNTERGLAVGTYEAMSPEQAEGSPDIDTRTDVYSLGVLLYELLVGAKPFDRETLTKASETEIRRILREVEPPRPSTRLRALGDLGTKIAAARQQGLEELRRSLRSELEWIPLKAMHKERDRRYKSVSYLADDVTAYLEGRALAAAPDSWGYRISKAYRRNRPVVAWALANTGVTLLMIWWPWFLWQKSTLNSAAGALGAIPYGFIFFGLLQAGMRLTGLAPRLYAQFIHLAVCFVGGVTISLLPWFGTFGAKFDSIGLVRNFTAQLVAAVLFLPLVMMLYRASIAKAILIQLMSAGMTAMLFAFFCLWSIELSGMDGKSAHALSISQGARFAMTQCCFES